MNQSGNLPRSGLGSLVLIAAVLGGGAAAFAYTAGGFRPDGAPLGHRRNHAKGICFHRRRVGQHRGTSAADGGR